MTYKNCKINLSDTNWQNNYKSVNRNEMNWVENLDI